MIYILIHIHRNTCPVPLSNELSTYKQSTTLYVAGAAIWLVKEVINVELMWVLDGNTVYHIRQCKVYRFKHLFARPYLEDLQNLLAL